MRIVLLTYQDQDSHPHLLHGLLHCTQNVPDGDKTIGAKKNKWGKAQKRIIDDWLAHTRSNFPVHYKYANPNFLAREREREREREMIKNGPCPTLETWNRKWTSSPLELKPPGTFIMSQFSCLKPRNRNLYLSRCLAPYIAQLSAIKRCFCSRFSHLSEG